MTNKENLNGAIKFQFRELSTFIHKDSRNNKENKHIDRFLSTELSKRQFEELAHYAKKLKIPITTFMIAQDPYLKTFVNNFTEANDGKAFYTGLKNLGEIIFKDYDSNKRKSL